MTDDRRASLPNIARPVEVAAPQYLWVLEGPGLGDVAMEDVAKFLAGIVKAVELACGHAVGRQVKQTGRREAIIEYARRIRLSTIASGSVQVYGSAAIAPEPSQGAPSDVLLTSETVSELGLSIALDAAKPKPNRLYRDVSAAWADLADELDIGERFERVRIVDLRTRRRSPAVIDRPARERLRRAATESTLRRVTTKSLRGYLFMANFDRRVAQLRTAAGDVVDIEFDPEHADAIQSALRHQPLVRGEVTYDPKTNRALAVHARQIDVGTQLDLFSFDFWNDSTIAQLRHGGGTPGVTNVDDVGLDLTTEEGNALAALVSGGDG